MPLSADSQGAVAGLRSPGKVARVGNDDVVARTAPSSITRKREVSTVLGKARFLRLPKSTRRYRVRPYIYTQDWKQCQPCCVGITSSRTDVSRLSPAWPNPADSIRVSNEEASQVPLAVGLPAPLLPPPPPPPLPFPLRPMRSPNHSPRRL